MTRARGLERLAIALAALVFGVALASAARAADGACIWNRLPQADRERFLAGYPETGGFGTFDALGGEDAVNAAISGCSAPDADRQDALLALLGVAEGRGSAAALKRDFGVEETRLRAAWLAQPAADRALFCHGGASFYTDGPDGSVGHAAFKDVEPISRRFLARLKLKDAPARHLAASWLLGECAKALGEAGS